MQNLKVKTKIIHRLKIAQGHLDKVMEMVDNGDYCIDVVHQSLAVQAALKSTDQVILKNHMETCMKEAIANGSSQSVIDEIMKVMEKK